MVGGRTLNTALHQDGYREPCEKLNKANCFLEYVDEMEEKTCIIPKNTALMFCYFNNIELFHVYLDQYKGPCVILVGPVDGARHCDPEPAYLEV